MTSEGKVRDDMRHETRGVAQVNDWQGARKAQFKLRTEYGQADA